MLEFLTGILALCAFATLIHSLIVHQAAKWNQQQLEKLIVAMATSILVSGRTVGEEETAVRLFNQQFPLLSKALKL